MAVTAYLTIRSFSAPFHCDRLGLTLIRVKGSKPGCWNQIKLRDSTNHIQVKIFKFVTTSWLPISSLVSFAAARPTLAELRLRMSDPSWNQAAHSRNLRQVKIFKIVTTSWLPIPSLVSFAAARPTLAELRLRRSDPSCNQAAQCPVQLLGFFDWKTKMIIFIQLKDVYFFCN